MVEVVVDQMTFGRAYAGRSHDYHFSNFNVVVATLIVTIEEGEWAHVSPQ